MRMRKLVSITAACFLMIVAGSAAADTRGLGAPDTVDLVYTVAPDVATNQLQVQLDLYVFSDSNYVEGAAMGFCWDNPNLQMDSAVASALAISSFEFGPFLLDGGILDSTNSKQRFLFAGAKAYGPGLAPADYRRLWASYYFTLSSWNANDSIVLDTLAWSTSTTYKFVGTGVGDYYPHWTGPLVQHDSSYAPMSNLIVSPDSLHFSALEGGSSPPAQSFEVSSDLTVIEFTLVEDVDWLIVNPVQGMTVQTINTLVNIVGLSAGTYVDSVRVESAQAANSPQYVIITLTIEPPPPTIAVTPDEFIFNAVAGGDNPPPKVLTITNTGGETLNWTVSSAESWLDLSPISGVDSGDVTLSVDIAGLAYGDYSDTVVVSDPSASNDPVRVPVFLSVGSDLPVIEVDSTFNTIIVEVPVYSIPPRMILIRNGGAGTMNFWLEESSSRIMSLDPGSGTAPQEVEVNFKIPGGHAGNDYYDTLWVHSNEAINSPFPVVFYFHYLEDPAFLSVNQQMVSLFVYECSQGWGGILESETFLVTNLGGDDPMAVELIYESDNFTVNADLGVAPIAFTITANDMQLPLGSYYDTILISAPKAVNSPEMLVVAYHQISGTQDPEIYLPKKNYVIPTQENLGPTPPVAFSIWNKHGGCMEWELVEDIQWVYPSAVSGDVVAGLSFNVNSAGFPFGEYPDTFQVVAPSATNSPEEVSVLMRVWRFHGDNDYDGAITIADLVYMAMYMFQFGPPAEPEFVVADMDCDHDIDIDDLAYMVEYMFNFGPIPCGNPY